jgi:hypothetical protein
VAVNRFPDSPLFSQAEVRDALILKPDCPIVDMNARDPRSSLATLVALVQHALERAPAEPAGGQAHMATSAPSAGF